MDNHIQQIGEDSLQALATLSPPKVSFEFFPPKSDTMEQALWESITYLAPLQPSFVSVTYGAGGTTRERTHATVARIRKETTLEPAAHLTCVGASRDEIDEIAEQYWQAGVRHIVALRGDAPDGAPYVPHPEGYAYAADLVAGLKRTADFEISVAAYPEPHPQSLSAEEDMRALRRKWEAGANQAITQFFFDVDIFLRYRDAVDKAGIALPLVPGILPVTNVAQLQRFAAMCGATIPQWLHHMCEGLDEAPSTRQLVAAWVAAEQCRRLRMEGVEQFHFYTLNRSELTAAICHVLGLRAAPLKAELKAE